jgi:hypothetical protein
MCKHFNEQKIIPVEQELSAMCDIVFKQVVTPEGKPAKKTAAAEQKSYKRHRHGTSQHWQCFR